MNGSVFGGQVKRPHETLRARTPDETYFHCRPACLAPRLEPRPQWPRKSPCAGPRALVRGRPGVRFGFDVRYESGRKQLPIITLQRAA